jgi:hypothetical protein
LPFASRGVAVSCTEPPTYTLGAAGLSVTDATGRSVTVIVAEPLLPSLVAVTVAVPVATPATRPPVDTVATPERFEIHVTIRPVSTLPFASLATTTSCFVDPTDKFADSGLTVTDATGTLLTATAAVPVFPSLVAVIVTAPGATADTSPVEDTVATAGALEAQVTGRPVRRLPAASNGVAASCVVPPTTTAAVAGLMTRAATETFATLMVADALFPSLVALTIAEPAAMPVTSPLDDTVATALLLVVQVSILPRTTFPSASLVVALSCCLEPTDRLAEAGLTAIEATGILVTPTTAMPTVPLTCAITMSPPAAVPAVYRPDGEIVPVVALQVTFTATESPVFSRP